MRVPDQAPALQTASEIKQVTGERKRCRIRIEKKQDVYLAYFVEFRQAKTHGTDRLPLPLPSSEIPLNGAAFFSAGSEAGESPSMALDHKHEASTSGEPKKNSGGEVVARDD